MSGFVVKAADAPSVVLIDWRKGYLDPTETVAQDLGWSVRDCANDGTPVEVAEQHHDFWRSWAEFRGGKPGRFYLVSARIQTSRGREVARSMVMRIATGPIPS